MLDRLAKDHKLWIRMVESLNCPKAYSEDIVQEMYLKIHRLDIGEKIMYNEDEVNKFYVYVTLRNLYIDSVKVKNRMRMVENKEEDEPDYVDGLSSFDDYDHERELALQRISNKIMSEVDSWHKYNAILCKLYFKTDMSLRYIAEGSGISLTSIYNSIRNYRDIIYEEFKEDVEDFNNGDYDKI